MEKIRCFIAIELSREAINQIKEVQELIKKKNLFHGKFIEPENLHLTLKFLGEIPKSKVKEVKERLKAIQFKEFEAYLDEIGVFSKKFVRIIWVKLNGKEIFELQKKIDEFLQDLFKPEFRFMSHITIARVKGVFNKKTLFDYLESFKTKKLKFRVKEFVFKKSELRPEGPAYSVIKGYKLR